MDFNNANFGKAKEKIEVRYSEGVEHANFWATPNNLLRGKGCPICMISHGARKVARFLDNHEIPYEVEWTGHGLRSLEFQRAVLRMDFHLLDRKTIIEFDGIQTLNLKPWVEWRQNKSGEHSNRHRQMTSASTNGLRRIIIK